jgi:hypothetical protein
MLNLIIPFFDFVGSETNRKNIDLQINSLSKRKGIRIILVEGVYKDELPNYSNLIYKHIRVKVESTIWIKENLINIGVKHLPIYWKNFAWIDKDLTFLNPNWVEETLQKLEYCDLVQPWSECVFLNNKFEIGNVDGLFFKKSPGERNRVVSFASNRKSDRNTWAHVGHAWSITRDFYNKIDKLFEGSIIGGGDSVISSCINQDYNNKDFLIYGEIYKEYCKKFKGVKLGYTNGLITHYPHGDMSQRKYVDRLEILNQHSFNFVNDLAYNKDGVLILKNRELEADILGYFKSRNE